MSEKKKQSDCNCHKDSNGTLNCPVHGIPEIEESEQKTYDSVPVTPEDIEMLNHGFYEEDLGGGLMNVKVPEEELERQRETLEYAQSFIDMKDEKNVPCYRTDQVHLKFTPEQLVVLKEALEAFSTRIELTDYLYTEREMGNLYQHQQYIVMLRDKVDDTLNEYLRHRPYSPFVGTWAKKIGKHDLDTKDI